MEEMTLAVPNSKLKALEAIRERMAAGRPATAVHVFPLSGTPGAGGSEIAALIAKKMELAVYDKDVIREFAELSGTKREALDLTEDKGDAKDFWLYRMFGGGEVTHDSIQRHLTNIFYALAGLGNCVILGRGAHIPLAGLADLRIRVVASKEKSVARIARRESVDRATAEIQYGKRLRSAGSFAWNVFGTRLNEPANFDVVINTDSSDDFDYWSTRSSSWPSTTRKPRPADAPRHNCLYFPAERV